METQVDESTLKALRAFRNQPYRRSYQVTITPKGKNRTHKSLFEEFKRELSKYKCVKDVFLIAEFENTCHFHGYIYTKDNCKFLNLYNKKHGFNFKISHREEIWWYNYILKHSNKQYI